VKDVLVILRKDECLSSLAERMLRSVMQYALGGNEYVGYTEYRSEVKSSIERGESRKLGVVRGGCYSRLMM